MSKAMFRDLTADEIEVRVALAKQNGVSLLLYKDARVDQNILDETVGPFNWMRSHNRDNANCVVSIWDGEKKQWISKEDTGVESNTEKEKGLASDSFKRACFNWGIGRELYTAPFIWVKAEDCEKLEKDGNRWKCGDSFTVEGITIKDKRIETIVIRNLKTKKNVYSWPNTNQVSPPAPQPAPQAAPQKQMTPRQQLIAELNRRHIDVNIYAKEHNLNGKTEPEVFLRLLKELENA